MGRGLHARHVRTRWGGVDEALPGLRGWLERSGPLLPGGGTRHAPGSGQLLGDAEGSAPSRPGGEQQLDEDVPLVEHDTLVLELHEELERLAQEHPRHAQVAELRYFVGLTIEETAEVLDVSPVTVRRDWAFTKACLKAKLDERESHVGED